MSSGLCINPTAVQLSSASGQPIQCFGEASVDIQLGSLRRSYSWVAVVADTTNALLGADFLSHFELLIDCKNAKLIDPETNRTHHCNIVSNSLQQIKVNNYSHIVKPILQEFPSLTSPRAKFTTAIPSSVKHSIDTSESVPTFAKVRQLSQEKYKAAKSEFTSMLEAGIIRQSKSPWASALHMVPKSSGKWRACGDYRNLNAITKPDRYPVPHIQSFSSRIANKKIFTKIDLLQAFLQIPMKESDIEKTAVITPFGLFEFLYMPYGLRNAGSTFQRFMDSIFRELDFVFVYLDDVLVFSESEETHVQHLKQVLQILHNHNLKITVEKCEFFCTELEYLGYRINEFGITPTPAKIKEINEFPEPADTKALRRFLGMINFYRKLIPKLADKALLLTELIKKNVKNVKIQFSDEERKSFINLKKNLAEAMILPHPVPDVTHYHLVTDSSAYAVGAALHQIINNVVISEMIKLSA